MAGAKKCDRVLLDTYTAPWDKGALRKTVDIFPSAVEADRPMLEDIEAIVKEAGKGDVGIVVYGDPYIATTHQSLREACIRAGVGVRTHYSSSFLNVLLGELGLHVYKIGFVGTVMKSPPEALYPIYAGVKRAYMAGKHSVLLIGYDRADDSSLTPNEAIDILQEVERSYGEQLFTPDLPAIVSCRLGSPTQRVWADSISSLSKQDFGDPPCTVVIPAKLHFTELGILKVVSSMGPEVEAAMGSMEVRSTARIRAEATIAKTRNALSLIGENRKGLSSLLENVELYLDDAAAFLNQGKEELALMESSYAEGLLDALRFQGLVNIRW